MDMGAENGLVLSPPLPDELTPLILIPETPLWLNKLPVLNADGDELESWMLCDRGGPDAAGCCCCCCCVCCGPE